MSRGASIDLGTNTCLLLIAEWEEGAHTVARAIEDVSTVVRLGEGVDQTGVLSESAMDRTFQCLRDYVKRVKDAGIDPSSVKAVATSSSRDAKNAVSFFDRIEHELGFHFSVISGEQEARASFQGALLPGINPNDAWVIDIGGGSTEFVSLARAVSIDMGAVRFFERYLAQDDPPSDEHFWKAQQAVDQLLKNYQEDLSSIKKGTLIGVAGTVTTLAAVYHRMQAFDAHKIDETVLTRDTLQRLVAELKRRTSAERLEMPGVQPGREDVLLAGALILWRVMEFLNVPELRVSSRGLRYGVLTCE